jgi:membrane fusion protein
MSQLFRDEVMQAKSAQYLGTIRIGRNPRFAVVALVAVMLAMSLVSFAVWAEVTRKAKLPGLLMPTLGTLNLTTPQAGTVLAVKAKEGDVVQAGQVLVVVSTDRATAQGDTAALVAISLRQRRATLESERNLAEVQSRQRQQALSDRLRSTTSERAQAEGEIEALQHRLQLSAKSVDRYNELARSGFVADIKAQEQQEAAIDLGTRDRNARSSLTVLERDAQSIRAEQAANASALQTQLAQIDRSLATLDQEGTENSARGQLVITAPQAGMVTALTLHAGQAVQPGQTLATVVPQASAGEASRLEAHLFAPSRTAGFVQPGQAVWLRYAAYPYQKFGMAQGHIDSVSRTPINPQDLPPGQAVALQQAAQSNEPLYRVTVTLDSQGIQTYGQAQPLKPGMALEADVLQDRRAVWEWVLEPVMAAAISAESLKAKPAKIGTREQ